MKTFKILNLKSSYILSVYFHSINTSNQYNYSAYRNLYSKNNFINFISTVKRKYNVLSLNQLLDFHNYNRKFKKKNIFFTFDDGYKDNLHNVLPILEKYSIPATIFITTGFINKEIFPYEYALAEIIKKRNFISLEWENKIIQKDIKSSNSKKQIYECLRKLVKFKNHSTRMELLHRLNFNKYVDEKQLYDIFLNWDDVKTLDKHHLINIGAHSHSHVPLTVDGLNLQKEILESKKLIEKNLEHEIISFSYPYGAVNKTVVDFIKESGYKLAFTTQEKKITKKSNPFRLPRFENGVNL